MKKKTGFTLIELLAVIVILAIIAVIATPIIVGIIEDSRKAAFERSVEGIIHATDIDFGTQETLANNTYTITDGELDKTLKTPIKNIEGFSGTIKYDDKGNSTYAIYNDKWCMKKTSEGITTEEYNAETCQIEASGGTGGNGGVGQTIEKKNGQPIYFDVVNGVGCTNYHPDNSLTGYNGIYEGENSTATTENQNSCLKFYAYDYEEGDTEVKLLLDHNTTAVAEWNSSGSIAAGPSIAETELLGKLKTDTASWAGTLTPADYTVTQVGYGNYTIDYSEYKARLITAQEIAEITGADKKEGLMFNENTTNSNNYFYFDTNTTSLATDCKSGDTTGCEYGWLYDRTSTSCTTYGCDNNADSGMTGIGYWTATSVFGNANIAWNVNYNGFLFYNGVNYVSGGVRPVITVLKSNL